MIEQLHLLRPLWLLTLVPLAWLLWRYWHRQQQGGVWQSVCDAHLLPHLLVGSHARGARAPLVLLAVAGVLTVIALAGPVWSKLPQPVFRNSAATVVLLNLSDTMNAADVTPTRLERAKLKLLDFLQRQREGQTALVAYAGEAYVVSPLTDDAATIASLVTPLTSDLMPVAGNQLSEALHKADELLDQSGIGKGGRILLITDNAGDAAALRAANTVRDNGRVLSVLGVGTDQGAPIAAAAGGFIKDSKGAIVIPSLNRDALQQLATAGQGRFVTLSANDDDLNQLWSAQQSAMLDPKQKGEDHVADVWREEGPWLLLLVVPLFALAWRRGWVVIIVLTVLTQPQPAQAFSWQDLWSRPDQQAYETLQRGDAKAAVSQFKDPRWQDVARYRAGDYAEAAAGFGRDNKPDARYNQGNALAHAGKLEEAAQAYRETLQQQPDNADAAHNLKIVEDLLKQRQSEQQQSKDGDSQDQQSAKDQSKDSQQQGKQSAQADSKDGQQQDKQQGQSEQQQGQDAEQQDGQPQQAQDGSQQDTQDKSNAGKQDAAAQEKEQAAADTAEAPDKDKQGQEESQQAATAQSAEENATAAAVDTAPAKTESAQALEQWLRRIPDDPGGLLRRKFMLQHQQRTGTNDTDGT